MAETYKNILTKQVDRLGEQIAAVASGVETSHRGTGYFYITTEAQEWKVEGHYYTSNRNYDEWFNPSSFINSIFLIISN